MSRNIETDFDIDIERLNARAAEIARVESARLLERTPQSKQWYERALHSMPMGVGSSFQQGDPYPIYLTHGKGSRLWDVDGNEYVDTHGGYKDSGYGKDMSAYSLEEYTQIKHAAIKLD